MHHIIILLKISNTAIKVALLFITVYSITYRLLITNGVDDSHGDSDHDTQPDDSDLPRVMVGMDSDFF